MRDVVKPLAVTYKGTFHQWFTIGVRARRILPTIWVHMCRVAQVSFHESGGNAGQHSGRSAANGVMIGILANFRGRENSAIPPFAQRPHGRRPIRGDPELREGWGQPGWWLRDR